MSVKFQYKSELESVTLLGHDGARLIFTACKLGRLAAGMQAIRTMAKFMNPSNPVMVTSFKRAIELACKAIDDVKNSPVLQGGLIPDAAEQVAQTLKPSHEVLCGSGGGLGTLTGQATVKGDLPSRIAFMREVICEWLITMLADSQLSDSDETKGPATMKFDVEIIAWRSDLLRTVVEANEENRDRARREWRKLIAAVRPNQTSRFRKASNCKSHGLAVRIRWTAAHAKTDDERNDFNQ